MFVFRPRSRKTQRLYYLKYGKVPVQVWENRVCHQWKNKKIFRAFCARKALRTLRLTQCLLCFIITECFFNQAVKVALICQVLKSILLCCAISHHYRGNSNTVASSFITCTELALWNSWRSSDRFYFVKQPNN